MGIKDFDVTGGSIFSGAGSIVGGKVVREDKEGQEPANVANLGTVWSAPQAAIPPNPSPDLLERVLAYESRVESRDQPVTPTLTPEDQATLDKLKALNEDYYLALDRLISSKSKIDLKDCAPLLHELLAKPLLADIWANNRELKSSMAQSTGGRFDTIHKFGSILESYFLEREFI